jgi:serine/threonine protein phosphatase PrpC
VEGVLAVTRAFGNNSMKPVIMAEPDVVTHVLTASDDFLIIASDGVWDMISNESAVRFLQGT